MDEEDQLYLALYRGEGVSIEQMCALLPKVINLVASNPIEVIAEPIYSKQNGHGENIMVLMFEGEGALVMTIDDLINNRIPPLHSINRENYH